MIEHPDQHVPSTAFAATEEGLRKRCALATLDVASFSRPLARCDLSNCRGMCCYDGVYVDRPTAELLETLAVERAADFATMGLSLPEQIIIEDIWCPSNLVTDQKTALRQFGFAAAVDGYPPHFRQTACVFLLEDGRCGLQVLAERDRKHPWYYKPFPCWLHPISLTETEITIHSDATDPYLFPWYDGYVGKTFCGRTCTGGAAAAELLEDEISFLSQILGRNLLSELVDSPRS